MMEIVTFVAKMTPVFLLIAAFLIIVITMKQNKPKTRIKKILEKEIRPLLRADLGDVELVDFDEKDGILKLRFSGACVGCPAFGMTLKNSVESKLKEEIPEIKEIQVIV